MSCLMAVETEGNQQMVGVCPGHSVAVVTLQEVVLAVVYLQLAGCAAIAAPVEVAAEYVLPSFKPLGPLQKVAVALGLFFSFCIHLVTI